MHQLVIQSHTVGRGATEDGVLPLAVLNNFGILCLGVAPKVFSGLPRGSDVLLDVDLSARAKMSSARS
jgi:hypothetical protein